MNMQEKKLASCPICRSPLPKQYEAIKFPKNFIALEIARKHQETLEKYKMCSSHQKEGLRYFCNTCQLLICSECIFDHSGHEFVRREESSFVVEETAQEIKKLISKAENGLNFLESKGDKDLSLVDKEVERIIKNVKKRGNSLKDAYQKLVNEEKEKIMKELETYQSQLKLLDMNKIETDEMLKGINEEEKEKDSQRENKLVHIKKLANFAFDLKKKLKSIQLKFPNIVLCQNDTDDILKKVGELSYTPHFKNKRICFFGDANKVMEYNLASRKWRIKQLHTSSDLLYYSAAVTLPNGDALIIGGGSSTVVYQYTNSGELIKRKSMNQVRKEHSAVIFGKIVYVMGGYDGIMGNFLES